MEGEGGVEDRLVDVAEIVDHALMVGVEEEDFRVIGADDQARGGGVVEPDDVEAGEVGDVAGRADVEHVYPAVGHALADLGASGVVLLVGEDGAEGPFVGQVCHWRLLTGGSFDCFAISGTALIV